jgi:hypothetical protein
VEEDVAADLAAVGRWQGHGMIAGALCEVINVERLV